MADMFMDPTEEAGAQENQQIVNSTYRGKPS